MAAIKNMFVQYINNLSTFTSENLHVDQFRHSISLQSRTHAAWLQIWSPFWIQNGRHQKVIFCNISTNKSCTLIKIYTLVNFRMPFHLKVQWKKFAKNYSRHLDFKMAAIKKLYFAISPLIRLVQSSKFTHWSLSQCPFTLKHNTRCQIKIMAAILILKWLP